MEESLPLVVFVFATWPASLPAMRTARSCLKNEIDNTDGVLHPLVLPRNRRLNLEVAHGSIRATLFIQLLITLCGPH